MMPQALSCLIISEAFSPIIMHAAFVFPDTIVGIMEPSAIRRPEKAMDTQNDHLQLLQGLGPYGMFQSDGKLFLLCFVYNFRIWSSLSISRPGKKFFTSNIFHSIGVHNLSDFLNATKHRIPVYLIG